MSQSISQRIVSLIASSTETVCALGYESSLVGRSHECDFPTSIQSLPACSEARFDLAGSSLEIDQRVKEAFESGDSVYRVFEGRLMKLQPDLIVTQDQCEVCAVSLKDVEEVACDVLESRPQIVSLAPSTLEEVYSGIAQIASAIGDSESGMRLVGEMRSRIGKIDTDVRASIRDTPPRIACVEWIEPFMPTGNWIPELVEIAGAIDPLGLSGEHTPYLPIQSLIEADPDSVIVMLCGWGIEKSRREVDLAVKSESWRSLRAVREGRLYIADGNHYFNRPSPRLVESLEILVEILYPDCFDFGHKGIGWERYSLQE